MAPRTKDAAHGRPTTKWATAATATVVARTRPTARRIIGLRCAQVERGEEDDEDHVRGYLDDGQPRHEAECEPPDDEQYRVGHLEHPG
jgi:hypothetical protein